MKGGMFEEKSMGPMFPRLHVNDADRGGPRAPPRNKMALYEQLTIPSNRYSYGNVHPNPHNGSNLVPTGSSSQGTSREKLMHFPLCQPPAEPTPSSRSVDGLQRQPSSVVNLRSPASLGGRRRKPEDEDDFAVPIFPHQGKEQCNDAHQNSNIKERGQDSSSFQKEMDCAENENSRQDRQCQDDEHRKAFVSGSVPTVKYCTDVSVQESAGGAMNSMEDLVRNGHVDVNRASMSKYTNINNRCSDYAPHNSINEAEGGTALRLKSSSPSGPSNRDKFDRHDEINQRGDNTLPRDTRADDVSPSSLVAAIPDLDISPDDVVDIIGLKHFFKARKAIVNQQRVFAVQVFELHRLIKVQKLIAKSPEILLDASAFLGNPPVEAPPLKDVSTKYALKAFADSDKQKDNTQSSDHNNKMEGAAESSAARAPTASPAHTQPSSQPPFLVDPALGSHTTVSPPMAANPKPTPWPFPQAGGHQWLVPVMSPSEGLIYKPYPGPGFPDPVYGGCGPPHGTMPPVGPFMNAGYGAPPSPYFHPHQDTPFSAQGYFPPYGMSMVTSSMSGSANANAKDQVSRPLGLHPNGENSQKAGAIRNLSTQQQGSCNIPTRKRHSEVLGSTGSSPSHAVRAKGKDNPTPFPCTPSKKAHRARDDQPNMVIKVVPHNARTATESAARIFRSIQEERQRQQSPS